MNEAIVTRTSVKRRTLLLSCASFAIATAALTPQKARAQAFNGTPTPVSGVTFDRATPGIETITISNPTATIDWSPNNGGTGTIIFLPSTNTATFQGDTGLLDYTVLNRIVPADPSRMIQFDGQVLSQLAGGATGGKVWFYSPGGIVVGATATFDVGGLLLTSLNPTTFDASGGTFSAGASTPGKIEIDANAKINADVATGSYVALIAPRIEQGGDVRVNGSAAYVATENLTMTMSQGLFDIQIPVNVDGNGGTGDDNGIVHTGTTTGPANAAEGDNHTIYMVAVPKNQALTMLLGGTVGFDAAATDATVKNGQIILSAGWNINDTGTDHDPTAAIGRNAGLDIGTTLGGDIQLTSDVYAIALGDISIGALSGDVTFAGDLDLYTFYAPGAGNIRLKAEAGHTLSIGGDLDTWSYQNASPGEVSISANGGHVQVDGGVVLDAPAGDVGISALAGGTVDILGDASLDASGSDGNGGSASISADGGDITIGGIASVNVDGYFNSAASSDSYAGDGQGGDISILASNSGSISAGGLDLAADGVGQDATGGYYSSGGTGGYGYGGYVDIDASGGGSIDIAGNVDVRADGRGGNVFSGGTEAGGGSGGTVEVHASSSASIAIGGKLTARADGYGGKALENAHYYTSSGETWSGSYTYASGGDGWGGDITIDAGNSGIISAAGIDLSADGNGGDGFGYAGRGYGGSIAIEGGGGSISVGTELLPADVNAHADGHGGNLLGEGHYHTSYRGSTTSGGFTTYFNSGTYADAGYGQGGDVRLNVNTGTIDVTGQLTLSANGVGGSVAGDLTNGYGGDGDGGGANIDSYGPGSITVHGKSTVTADGTGGDGQDGGDGYGGIVGISAQDGAIHFADSGDALYLAARGQGGDASLGFGGNGGDGQGGNAYMEALSYPGDIPVSGTITGANAVIDITGIGGVGGEGDGDIAAGYGGDGYGGAGFNGYASQFDASSSAGAYIHVEGSATLTLGNVGVIADGLGGAAHDVGDGTGGDGYGGIVEASYTDPFQMGVGDGKMTFGALALNASGQGGVGYTGGYGQGGEATVTADVGDLHTDGWVVLNVAGIGGNSSMTGGGALGGDANFDARGTVTAQGIGMYANATGGDGQFGGGATDGNVDFHAYAGSIVNTNGLELGGIESDDSIGGATGGAGTVQGGTATGGVTSLTIDSGASMHTRWAALFALGYGGSSSSGTGGDGQGGTTTLSIAGTGDLTLVSGLVAFADAHGGASLTGTGGNGQAGDIALTLDGGTLLAPNYLAVTADAFGGDGATAGSATGGTSTFEMTANGGSITTNNFELHSWGNYNGGGGVGVDAGGDATGGTVLFDVASALNAGKTGTITFGNALIDTSAIGGIGAVGGDGTGGTTTVNLGAANTTITGTATVKSDGTGGNGSNGSGGGGTGGLAYIVAQSSGINDVHAAVLSANGTGGSGSGVEASGGTGTGGTVTAFASTAMGSLQFDTLTASANGVGGTGAIGGSSVGGLVDIWSQDGATLDFGAANLSALGDGGAVNVADHACDCTLDAVTGASLAIDSGGDFALGDVTLTGAADLTAAGIANFFGTLSAPTITVTSGDINIVSGASLGVMGLTELLTLNAVANGSPIVIGGSSDIVTAAVDGGYQLWEDGDLHANALVINALPGIGGAAPDVVVHDVKIEGSQGETGHVGDVTLNTTGSILVDGLVNFINAGSGDSLTLNAGLIEVNTDTGSVVMTDINGKSGGLLSLNADNVWVGDGALLTALEEDVNFAGRDAAIATNNGPVVNEGYLRSGEVHAAVADTLFIQNSGAPDDFAGVTTGDGTFTIVATGEGAADVTVYGRQIKSDGTVVGGDDFAVDAVTVGTFTEGSTINGCSLNNCGVVTPPPVVPPPVVPPPVVPPPVVPPPVVPPPVVPPPVVPPPVVPPPVVPPPVVPPPVVPPPVVPPPVVPPPVVVPPEVPQATNSGQVLGSVGGSTSPIDMVVGQDQGSQADDQDDGDDSDDDSSGGKKTSVKAGLGLINSSPVELDQEVDDPVTSGNDWMAGD